MKRKTIAIFSIAFLSSSPLIDPEGKAMGIGSVANPLSKNTINTMRIPSINTVSPPIMIPPGPLNTTLGNTSGPLPMEGGTDGITYNINPEASTSVNNAQWMKITTDTSGKISAQLSYENGTTNPISLDDTSLKKLIKPYQNPPPVNERMFEIIKDKNGTQSIKIENELIPINNIIISSEEGGNESTVAHDTLRLKTEQETGNPVEEFGTSHHPIMDPSTSRTPLETIAPSIPTLEDLQIQTTMKTRNELSGLQQMHTISKEWQDRIEWAKQLPLSKNDRNKLNNMKKILNETESSFNYIQSYIEIENTIGNNNFLIKKEKEKLQKEWEQKWREKLPPKKHPELWNYWQAIKNRRTIVPVRVAEPFIRDTKSKIDKVLFMIQFLEDNWEGRWNPDSLPSSSKQK